MQAQQGLQSGVFALADVGDRAYARIAGVLAGGKHVDLLYHLQDVSSKGPEHDGELALLHNAAARGLCSGCQAMVQADILSCSEGEWSFSQDMTDTRLDAPHACLPAAVGNCMTRRKTQHGLMAWQQPWAAVLRVFLHTSPAMSQQRQ